MSRSNSNGSRDFARNRSKQNNNGSNPTWLVAGGIVVIILVILIIVVNIKKKPESEPRQLTESASETEETTVDKTKLKNGCEIDLSSIPGLDGKSVTLKEGMDRSDALEEIRKHYEWNVTAVNKDAAEGAVVKPTVGADETTAVGSGDTETEASDQSDEVAALKEIVVQGSISMDDPIQKSAEELLERIFEDDKQSKSSEISLYQLKLSDLEGCMEEFVQDAEDMWYVEAKGGSIESYDQETDEFLMEGSSEGCCVDSEKLLNDLKTQLEKGNFKCSIPVKLIKTSSENSVENGEYTIIAEYITHTTGNPVRNNNIRLACEKLNGTIIRPGEEFSYNHTIGERTEDKGYGAAAAYSNGEVVQEVGGGVCQVSSTLYNAITEAGLKTTYRSPHTFKPTYVSPGQDATVSWNGPDYRFANVIAMPDISYDSTYAIGIRAVYEDQTVTVSIYGRPVLKPGYKVVMESEMTGEIEMVRETIPEGSEREPSEGDKGSTWKTYLHITRDGEEVSREVYHTTKYKGHTEYYYETLPESSSEGESASETMPEAFGPGYTGSGQSAAEPSGLDTPEDTNPGPGESEGSSQDSTGSVTPGPTAQIIDAPGGIPGYENSVSTEYNGPKIIEDGP